MATFIVDGHPVTVHTAIELVRHMHECSRTQAADDKAYMLDVSERSVTQSGAKVRTSSPEAFVNDLVQYGFLECIKGEPLLASAPPDQEN